MKMPSLKVKETPNLIHKFSQNDYTSRVCDNTTIFTGINIATPSTHSGVEHYQLYFIYQTKTLFWALVLYK